MASRSAVGEFVRGAKPNEPRRTIKTIKNLPEVSLVAFPMNELARTGEVKASTSARCEISRTPARCARLSNAAAESIAQRGFKVANEQPSRLDSLIAALRDVCRQI